MIVIGWGGNGMPDINVQKELPENFEVEEFMAKIKNYFGKVGQQKAKREN